MNLANLFEMQAALNTHIEHEHPRLEIENRLEKKVLALLVELGELANEFRGFKYWSNNQEPHHEKMLEEYVDCLHFALSIGLEINIDINTDFNIEKYAYENEIICFNETFLSVSYFNEDPNEYEYSCLVRELLNLGKQLGFNWEQIEQAYIKKNEINHQRQLSGY